MKECFKCKKVLEDKDFWKGCLLSNVTKITVKNEQDKEQKYVKENIWRERCNRYAKIQAYSSRKYSH